MSTQRVALKTSRRRKNTRSPYGGLRVRIKELLTRGLRVKSRIKIQKATFSPNPPPTNNGWKHSLYYVSAFVERPYCKDLFPSSRTDMTQDLFIFNCSGVRLTYLY